jgi:hypothetical protein
MVANHPAMHRTITYNKVSAQNVGSARLRNPDINKYTSSISYMFNVGFRDTWVYKTSQAIAILKKLELVECLPSKCEILSSNPSIAPPEKVEYK